MTTEPLSWLDAVFMEDERERDRSLGLDDLAKREYVRDAKGRFAEVSGGSGAGGTDAPTVDWPARVAGGIGYAAVVQEVATAALSEHFPKARVQVSSSAYPDVVKATTDALLAMDHKFPRVADEIVSIRIIPAMEMSTPTALGETMLVRDNVTGRVGVQLNFNSSEMSRNAFENVKYAVENGRWGEKENGTWSHRGNVYSIKNHTAYVASTAVHEFGHAVHLNATRRDLNHMAWQEQAPGDTDNGVWNSVAHPWDAAQRSTHDNALMTYTENARARQVPPPSEYGGAHPAETFAEAFAFRHGPEGSGLTRGATRLDPPLAAILDGVEEIANG